MGNLSLAPLAIAAPATTDARKLSHCAKNQRRKMQKALRETEAPFDLPHRIHQSRERV
jgi:hypothetical protein